MSKYEDYCRERRVRELVAIREGAATVRAASPCPMATCIVAGPHDHAICPDCGAVRFGNISCDTCREHHDAER